MPFESALRGLAEALQGSGTSGALERRLTGPGGHPPAAGLEIYRNNHRGARQRALREAFPACAAVLGESCFRALAGTWIARTPSREDDLNLHGSGFADWLEGFAAGRADLAALPYLSDLARLEWARHRAWYAPDSPALDYAALEEAAALGASLRLVPAPSLSLLVSPWPVRDILEGYLSGAVPQELQAPESPEHLVVGRSGTAPSVSKIPRSMWELLAASARGDSLEAIVEEHPGLGPELGALLARAVERGWLTGFHAGGDRV